MATLEKIRNRAGLLVIAVGLALFAFIIGDFLRSGSTFFRQSKEKVVIVDGEAISIHEYQAKIDDMTEVYKMQTGNSSISDDIMAQLRESVFENFIRQTLMGEISDKVGFTVSKKELSDMVMGDNVSPMIQQMPMFRNPQTGMFDKNELVRFLQIIEGDLNEIPEESRANILQYKKFWLFWENNIKQQKLEEKFNNLLSKAVVANSLDARADFDNNKVSVDFDYVEQPYNTIPDDQVAVGDDEIKKLYEKRKNEFKQENTRVISYISVDILPSQEDFKEVESTMSGLRDELITSTDMSALVNSTSDVPFVNAFSALRSLDPEMARFVENANIGDVEGPALVGNTYHLRKLVDKSVGSDSIKLNQVSLPAMDETAMKAYTDSLISEMKAKSFAEVVAVLSSGQTNGEMGWMTEADLLRASDEQFKNAAFSAPLNDIVVVKSKFGTHLVQVTEKTSPVTKYKVADIVNAVTPSENTYNKLYNDLNKYISENSTLDKFKSAASESGYVCQPDFPVRTTDQRIGIINNSRPIVRWAFEHKKGSISEIFDCQDKFVVAAVENEITKGFSPLNSVSDILKRSLLNEKKGEKIVADLKARNLTDMQQYSDAMRSPVQSVKFVSFGTSTIAGIGTEPVLNQKAPLAEIGKISEPTVGKNAVYVFKVTDKQTSQEEFNLEQQQQKLDGANYRLIYQAIPVLRDKADIVDNRINFY